MAKYALSCAELRRELKDVFCTETMEAFSAFCVKFAMLLAVQSTVGSTPLCPKGCRCTGGFPATSLTVDCQTNVNVSREQLTEQLDSLLSSNLTYGRLRSLTIANTSLTSVPRSVCRLTTLTQLNLDSNQLTRLPDNCLSNLGALTSFSACDNHITELQDGVFDGLHKLKKLMLSHNLIMSIGLRVFHCPVRLTRLTVVDLSYNGIQSLEPWPVYLGQNGQFNRKTLIQLDYNNISTFSNIMGCELYCNMKAVYVNLRLGYNQIRHLSDLLHGWNINITEAICIFFRNMHYKTSSSISLRWNYMDCDCVDFDIYKMILPQTRRRREKLLTDVFCNSPDSLYDDRMITVNLDQFVCELTERCPAGCRCVHCPANATLHVHCSDTNLTVLPFELPKLPKSNTKNKIDFSNNRGLHRLEHRTYFVNTSTLDVSNCNLDAVDFQMWKDLTIKYPTSASGWKSAAIAAFSHCCRKPPSNEY